MLNQFLRLFVLLATFGAIAIWLVTVFSGWISAPDTLLVILGFAGYVALIVVTVLWLRYEVRRLDKFFASLP